MIDPNNVQTKKDFLDFIYALVDDYEINKNEPYQWENNTINLYLAALAGWVEDMEGAYKFKNEQVPENVNWNVIARMLAAATDYE